ncbi:MAG: isochorismate synthase [Bacteroidetes bacterium]|nr:isochorismate synthase [Bacteroidota bacterium]
MDPIQILQDDHISIGDSGADLKSRLRSSLIHHVELQEAGASGLVRIEMPIPNVDPLKWLKSQKNFERLYWRGRHADDRVAMCGVAKVLSGDTTPEYDELAQEIDDFLERPGAEFRLYGGMRFDLSRKTDRDWFGFPAWRFVLPRFELHRRGQRTLLCCNLVFPEDQSLKDVLLEQVDELVFPDQFSTDKAPVPISRVVNPSFDGWKSQVGWSLDAFDRDVLQKVVLARRVDFSFAESTDPVELLNVLQEATPNCFHFLFESEQGSFIGASPERLFFRRGREVFSEAVAGTRPRGDTSDDDQAYCASLLASEKDQREHAFVRDRIRSVLQDLCHSVAVDEVASEMRLAGGRHLYSRLSGTLYEGITDLQLLKLLHPTPAVGGEPTDIALHAIDSLEDFDRGWYAGPIGWLGRDSAEFAVALRCGVLHDKTLSLFSGAGLVKGSDPGSEWLEIEQKITDFTKILGLAVKSAK